MTSRKNIGREQIIETAVRLIDENGGTKDVTLREIAKELGCAHTNLYNYFNGLNEIYWAVLGEIIRLLLDYLNQPSDAKTPEEILLQKHARFIDFYIDHPGWYRLAWLEPLTGSAPPEIEQAIRQPMMQFSHDLQQASSRPLSTRETMEICDVLFMYSLGELGSWINHRTAVISRVVMQRNVVNNIKRLFELLTK